MNSDLDPVVELPVDPGDGQVEVTHVLAGLFEGGHGVDDAVGDVGVDVDQVAEDRHDAELDAQLVVFEEIETAVDPDHEVAEFRGPHAGDPVIDAAPLGLVPQDDPGLEGGEREGQKNDRGRPELRVGLEPVHDRHDVRGPLAEIRIEHLVGRLVRFGIVVAFSLLADAVVTDDGQRLAEKAEVLAQGQGQAEEDLLRLAEGRRDDDDGDGLVVERQGRVEKADDLLAEAVLEPDDLGRHEARPDEIGRRAGSAPDRRPCRADRRRAGRSPDRGRGRTGCSSG